MWQEEKRGAAERGGNFLRAPPYPCSACDVELVLQAGEGLLVVAQLAVQGSQLAVSLGLLPSFPAELMGDHQPLLEAHQRLLQITHGPGV